MHRPHRIAWLLAATAIMAFIVGVAFLAPPADAARSAKADDNGNCGNPRVLPPQSYPYGKSYGEWSEAWWQWLWSAPVDQNPGLDETGAFIGYGQSGPVWFLAPNYGGVSERYATIPPGKALFVDVLGWFDSPLLGDGPGEAELRAAVKAALDATDQLVCEVDGVPLENLTAYRFASPTLFSYTLPENNMFQLMGYDAPAGAYDGAVCEGYYVMLAPLAVGEHVIHIIGAASSLGLYSEVTIHLQVSGSATAPGSEALSPADAPAPTTQARSWSSVKALYR